MPEPFLKFYDDQGFETQITALVKSQNHKILRRIIFPKTRQVDILKLPEYADYSVHRGIYLDTETTGLSHAEDEVIQLCMLPFIYGKNPDNDHLVIFGVYSPYIGFQQPSKPLPQLIIDLTGITMEMLVGQSLDIEKIEKYLDKSEIIIAHNAAFDRPFTHAISDKFRAKNWACSMADINWSSQGFDSQKLGHLAASMGYYFDAHQADKDCYAGLCILQQLNPEGSSYFNQMMLTAQKDSVTLRALHAAFDKKNLLKDRGYRWKDGSDGILKGWQITITEDEAEAERQWLTKNIYKGEAQYYEKIQTAETRYS